MAKPIACFNPRPRVGGDKGLQYPILKLEGFNPRPRVGGDPRHLSHYQCNCSFNPRPRVGGDSAPGICTWQSFCFNPRPRVGGDCLSLIICFLKLYFLLSANLLFPLYLVFNCQRSFPIILAHTISYEACEPPLSHARLNCNLTIAIRFIPYPAGLRFAQAFTQ